MKPLGPFVALACLAGACAGGTEATDIETVEVFGPYRGAEADRFGDVLSTFEAVTGIEIQYIGSDNFEIDLARRTEALDPPDIAIVPQLGLLDKLIDDQVALPIRGATREAVAANYSGANTALGEVDQTLYAVPYRVTVKSLVWYQPAVFAEYGWEPPATLDELETLVRHIPRDSELVPWCFGMEAGSATGWAATDWAEDLVLRSIGLDEYQRWAAGDLPFADPEIEAAFTTFQSLVVAPGRTLGDLPGILETPVEEVVTPLLGSDPQCALYKQGDFAVGWMPDDIEIGPDGEVNFFVLPAEDDEAPPVVVGGDQAVQFRSSPGVDAVMTYLASPESAVIWIRYGGFISPNGAVEDDAYPQQYLRAISAAVTDAPAVAYDASDQMPPSIGAGVLWPAITSWVSGGTNYSIFASEVDTAYEELRAATPESDDSDDTDDGS